MHVNASLPFDETAVSLAVKTKMPLECQKELNQWRNVYAVFGWMSILCFLSNFIISSIFILQFRYLDYTTVFSLLNSFLLLSYKVYIVYGNVYTKGNHIFFSGYLTAKVQFNDVDPDCDIIIKQSVSERYERSLQRLYNIQYNTNYIPEKSLSYHYNYNYAMD
jgi:hypothetical protein